MNRKEFVLNAVSRKQDLVVEVSDRIFDFAETGFHEFETAKLYQQVLEKEGFNVVIKKHLTHLQEGTIWQSETDRRRSF